MIRQSPKHAGRHLSPFTGRGRIASAIRVRGRLFNGTGYGLKNSGDVAQDIVIPESQNPITACYKPRVARRVARILRVLSAIDLDDQAMLTADKIDRVGADRLLAHEFTATECTRPQSIPQRLLGACCISAQPSRTRGRSRVGSTHMVNPPHPARMARRPLPASGARLSQLFPAVASDTSP